MRDEISQYEKLGVRPVGINPAAPDKHAGYAERLKLPFPLLSDPDGAIAKRYNAAKPLGIGITRTVYLVGKDGTILYGARGAPGAEISLAPLAEPRRTAGSRRKPKPSALPRTMLTFDFSGKVVLVTGVARVGQIGYAVAEAFGRSGAKLVAADRNAVAVAERAREFQALGIEARPAAGDLTEADIAALAVETAIKHYGRLDVLVNVAGGLTTFGPLLETSPDDFDREVAINLKTAYVMCRASVTELARARGCIINFASAALLHPDAGLSVYGAAKGGVAGFTTSLAAELWPRGVRVNAIAPTMVRTVENVASVGESAHYVEMKDIVNAVMFLASEGSAAITGHLLPITSGS